MPVIREDNYLKTNLNYTYYSESNDILPNELKNILNIFKKNIKSIESINKNNYGQKSDLILKTIEKDLIDIGFNVESDKNNQIRIQLDRLKNIKEFRVDAINLEKGIIIEVEAGRAVSNYQFLKDIIECSMISSKANFYINNEKVIIDNKLYLVLAVRNVYYFSESNHYDYKTIITWLNALDVSKLNLKIKGILLIGY